MKRLITCLYWIGCFALCCLASLYLAAMLIAPSAGLQVASMLGFQRGSDISIFCGWLYTTFLVATAFFSLMSLRYFYLRYITFVSAGTVLGLTIFPLTYSIIYDFNPSFFENYVGEFLTILALIVLVVAVAFLPKQKIKEQNAIANP